MISSGESGETISPSRCSTKRDELRGALRGARVVEGSACLLGLAGGEVSAAREGRGGGTRVRLLVRFRGAGMRSSSPRCAAKPLVLTWSVKASLLLAGQVLLEVFRRVVLPRAGFFGGGTGAGMGVSCLTGSSTSWGMCVSM
jgi:hypothetical protein